MRVRLACLGVLVIVSGLPLGVSGARAEERPAARPPVLAGHWKLNEERSGDAQAKPAQSGESRKNREPSNAAPEDDPRGGQKTAQPVSLTITQTEAEVVVEEKPGSTRSVYPNGKTYKADEGASDVRTTWKDGALVTEKKNVQGWRMTETWRLSPDGKRLQMDLRVEGGKRPRMSIKRVYDRVEPTS
jgi:hypothetical protein